MVKWMPPPSREFKVNIDAAINVEAGEVEIGAVCRDAGGRVIGCCSCLASSSYIS